MSRLSKEYGTGASAAINGGGGSYQQHRRGRSLTGSSTIVNSRDTDENLDLFSRNRRTLSLTSDESDGITMKLGKVGIGSVKLGRNGGMDDLLASVDGGGKNDYDWLLTPPGTPLLSDANESHQTLAPSRSIASVRSVSSSKTSRLSVTQTENSYPSRPIRSSSVTRSYSSNLNRSSSILNTSSGSVTSISRPSSSILNTSSASVTSISRPATPNSRSTFSSSSINRPSTPTSRVSRPSTPIKSRPTTNNNALGEKTRAPQNHPRPLTPTSRPQTPTTSNPLVSRTSSRPSTPTRRTPTLNQQLNGNSPSTSRVIGNGRNSAPVSRGNSPSPRPRPVVPPDFPLDTPPNLRTTMPDRPVSAGRSRPSTPSSIRGNSEPTVPPRRQSSPIVARGRLPDLGKARPHGNGHNSTANENLKTPPSVDSAMRRSAKSATPTESTGFGRTISKKSLDMALRHMDIRSGSGGVRSSPGSTLFPQSIRPGTTKGHSARVSDIPGPVAVANGPLENGKYNDRPRDNEYKVDVGRYIGRVGEPDIYESSRYDSILLKEDIKNTNWLMNVDDDKSDQGSIFDHRFESLPEPFDPL